MPDHKQLQLQFISRQQAKAMVHTQHYMATYPQGAKVNVGFVDPSGQVVGLIVFGYSSATDAKVAKMLGKDHGLQRTEYLELQRMWLSDAYGHNSESWCMARTMQLLKRQYGLRLVVTHAGGCKDDCGIVYQAANWVYFGSVPCNDFFRTRAGAYKNMVAAMRFGRVSSKGKTPQQVGEELFGPGAVVEAKRHLYAYPVDKRLRPALEANGLPYPKDSARFRKGQQWQDDVATVGCASG